MINKLTRWAWHSENCLVFQSSHFIILLQWLSFLLITNFVELLPAQTLSLPRITPSKWEVASGLSWLALLPVQRPGSCPSFPGPLSQLQAGSVFPWGVLDPLSCTDCQKLLPFFSTHVSLETQKYHPRHCIPLLSSHLPSTCLVQSVSLRCN